MKKNNLLYIISGSLLVAVVVTAVVLNNGNGQKLQGSLQNISRNLSKNTSVNSNAITTTMTGKVLTVNDPKIVLKGSITPGMQMTTTYTYTPSSSTDENPDPTSGSYTFTGNENGLTTNVGQWKFTTDPSNINFNIKAYNKAEKDEILIFTTETLFLTNIGKQNIAIDVQDFSGKNLTSDTLPIGCPASFVDSNTTQSSQKVLTSDGDIAQVEIVGSIETCSSTAPTVSPMGSTPNPILQQPISTPNPGPR